MEARKASREAALRGKEVLEKTEDMDEPMPEKSPIASGALTPPARGEACRKEAVRSASRSGNRRTERREPRRRECDKGVSMRVVNGGDVVLRLNELN